MLIARDVNIQKAMKAVCLLSGGLDSSTCLGVARRDGVECYALSFDYSQRHKAQNSRLRRVWPGTLACASTRLFKSTCEPSAAAR